MLIKNILQQIFGIFLRSKQLESDNMLDKITLLSLRIIIEIETVKKKIYE